MNAIHLLALTPASEKLRASLLEAIANGPLVGMPFDDRIHLDTEFVERLGTDRHYGSFDLRLMRTRQDADMVNANYYRDDGLMTDAGVVEVRNCGSVDVLMHISRMNGADIISVLTFAREQEIWHVVPTIMLAKGEIAMLVQLEGRELTPRMRLLMNHYSSLVINAVQSLGEHLRTFKGKV
jgi:hypothetical protein